MCIFRAKAKRVCASNPSAQCVDFIVYVCDCTAETSPPDGGQEKEIINLIKCPGRLILVLEIKGRGAERLSF